MNDFPIENWRNSVTFSRDAVKISSIIKTLSEMGERGCFLFSRPLALILAALM
jgi:hypothetical protein